MRANLKSKLAVGHASESSGCLVTLPDIVLILYTEFVESNATRVDRHARGACQLAAFAMAMEFGAKEEKPPMAVILAHRGFSSLSCLVTMHRYQFPMPHVLNRNVWNGSSSVPFSRSEECFLPSSGAGQLFKHFLKSQQCDMLLWHWLLRIDIGLRGATRVLQWRAS